MQLRRASVIVTQGIEICGGGWFNDYREASFQELFRQKPAVTPSCIMAWMHGLADPNAPNCAGAAWSRALS